MRNPAHDLLPSISRILAPQSPAPVGAGDQQAKAVPARTPESPGYALRRRNHAAKVKAEVKAEESTATLARLKTEVDDSAVEYQQTAEALLLLSDSP